MGAASDDDTHIAGDCYATRNHPHGDLYPKFYTKRAGDQFTRVQLRGRGDGQAGGVGEQYVDGGVGLSEPEIQDDGGSE